MLKYSGLKSGNGVSASASLPMSLKKLLMIDNKTKNRQASSEALSTTMIIHKFSTQQNILTCSSIQVWETFSKKKQKRGRCDSHNPASTLDTIRCKKILRIKELPFNRPIDNTDSMSSGMRPRIHQICFKAMNQARDWLNENIICSRCSGIAINVQIDSTSLLDNEEL